MQAVQGAGRPLSKWFVFGALALLSWSATASEFSVGSVDVKFAEEGWQSLALSDTKRPYGGDRVGALVVSSKVFWRDHAASGGLVIVVVNATNGGTGPGYMTYDRPCKSDDSIYREGNSGFSRSSKCLVVTPAYTANSVLKELAPDLIALRDAGSLVVGTQLFVILSRHAVASGTDVEVQVFLSLPIATDASALGQAVPQGVPPGHLVWGRELMNAVSKSVHSISGRLAFPPIP